MARGKIPVCLGVSPSFDEGTLTRNCSSIPGPVDGDCSTGSRSRVLSVPFFRQPTGNTCQSTCLKMMAAYLEEHVVYQSTEAGNRDIQNIWSDINESENRPAKLINAHANFKWWLEYHFPSLHFEYLVVSDEAAAAENIVRFIDGGFPVLVSVSHANNKSGHIILVVGYEDYQQGMSSFDFNLVVHDPFGEYDPSLRSTLWGKERTKKGNWSKSAGTMSLASGGIVAPGRYCRVPVTAGGRQYKSDSRKGKYYLLSGTQ